MAVCNRVYGIATAGGALSILITQIFCIPSEALLRRGATKNNSVDWSDNRPKGRTN
jgi:hypothetical protein